MPPNNENPWAKDLLSWHSHDRGGVHVPFQPGANPYGSVIVTDLVQRLRKLAHSIAIGEPCPRWIFLVGGPGNGKSETVQDFLSALDQELGMAGALRTRLEMEFSPNPLVARRVEVTAASLGTASATFASRVGKLVVVQDATATDEAPGNAAQQLANDVFDLLTTPESPIPVFIACTNRGLLSRAVKEAFLEWNGDSPATKLFAEILRASSLSLETLRANRPSCWPLQIDGSGDKVACWPLDQESLMLAQGGAASPVDQVLVKATASPLWEEAGRCLDCGAREVCPLRQNAEWLRNADRRSALVRVLRHGELATGQRWNFRDTFSLAADLLVGEWDDFGRLHRLGERELRQPDAFDHPCKWVHDRVEAMGAGPGAEALAPALELLNRLYPHAMFPSPWLQPVAEQLASESKGFLDQPTSGIFVGELARDSGKHPKPIREKLLSEYARFDPANYTPGSPTHVLHQVENEYSQSVAVGNGVSRRLAPAAVETRFLESLTIAEAEWDLLSRESVVATNVVRLLRRAGSVLVKRSLGVRLGHHAYEAELEEFSATLRDQQRLSRLKESLQEILGGDRFRFNLVESYGQPTAEEERMVVLESDKPGMRTYVAPLGSDAAPGHDVPCFSIGNDQHRVPITFDFFLALHLRSTGCANSSLPRSVSASIDRVRHRYAGQLCRDQTKFSNGTARVLIGAHSTITLPDEDSSPAVSQS